MSDYFTLADHSDPRIRSRAISTSDLAAGTRVLSDAARATALIPSEKGNRCDWCMRKPQQQILKRCSRCTVYYYCSSDCQSAHWTRGGHRTICKYINSWLASPTFQRLDAQRRGDALLLTHFLAAHRDSPAETEDLLDLLPHPSIPGAPPVCPPLVQSLSLDVQVLFGRFENNNFVVHSHLTPIAHGIFTTASRTLNHSCEPNCVSLFGFAAAEQPTMNVVLVKDVRSGDELTIPYVDPALDVRTRRERLKTSYGFDCNCTRCMREMARASAKAQAIRPQTGVDAAHSDPTLAIPVLSAEFSDLAHGDAAKYVDALEVGDRLLASYQRVYPPFYPLIASHLAELAKTAWNAALQYEQGCAEERAYMTRCAAYIPQAEAIYQLLGREGDTDDGGLSEIGTLRDLLRQEGVLVGRVR